MAPVSWTAARSQPTELASAQACRDLVAEAWPRLPSDQAERCGSYRGVLASCCFPDGAVSGGAPGITRLRSRGDVARRRRCRRGRRPFELELSVAVEPGVLRDAPPLGVPQFERA